MHAGLERLAVISICALWLIACRSRTPAAEVVHDTTPAQAETVPTPAPSDPPATDPAWEVIGHSTDDRPIELARFGDGPLTVLILATIHGDEAAGAPLLRELANQLAADPDWLDGRRVLVVPVCNPDGFARDSRFNAHFVDLNRNFPAANHRSRRLHGREPLSEPESEALHRLILAEEPARILSLHQAANCIDFDGPARELAECMSAAADLPLELMGARPGSLGSFAGVDLGLPTVTIELPRSATLLDGLDSWERYGEMLREAIRFPDPSVSHAP